MKVSFSPDVMPSGWLGSKHQLTNLHSERQTPSRSFQYSSYGVVPKGLFTFLGFFYAMRSLGPVGHFPYISEHLLTWLVRGSFQWRHGLLFTDCIVWYDKDKVIGFQRSHWIHLGWWSTGSPELQLFQLSQHSYVTNCRLISSSAYFPWNMTLKYKMQQSEGSWDKILHSKSRTQCFSKEEKKILVVCLSKRYTKVPEVVFATSL